MKPGEEGGKQRRGNRRKEKGGKRKGRTSLTRGGPLRDFWKNNQRSAHTGLVLLTEK